MFDPTVEPQKEVVSDAKLIPLYRDAKIVGGVLPGELNNASRVTAVFRIQLEFFKQIVGYITAY